MSSSEIAVPLSVDAVVPVVRPALPGVVPPTTIDCGLTPLAVSETRAAGRAVAEAGVGLRAGDDDVAAVGGGERDRPGRAVGDGGDAGRRRDGVDRCGDVGALRDGGAAGGDGADVDAVDLHACRQLIAAKPVGAAPATASALAVACTVLCEALIACAIDQALSAVCVAAVPAADGWMATPLSVSWPRGERRRGGAAGDAGGVVDAEGGAAGAGDAGDRDRLAGVGADLELLRGERAVEQVQAVELGLRRDAVDLGRELRHFLLQRGPVGGAVGRVGRLHRQLAHALQVAGHRARVRLQRPAPARCRRWRCAPPGWCRGSAPSCGPRSPGRRHRPWRC